MPLKTRSALSGFILRHCGVLYVRRIPQDSPHAFGVTCISSSGAGLCAIPFVNGLLKGVGGFSMPRPLLLTLHPLRRGRTRGILAGCADTTSSDAASRLSVNRVRIPSGLIVSRLRFRSIGPHPKAVHAAFSSDPLVCSSGNARCGPGRMPVRYANAYGFISRDSPPGRGSCRQPANPWFPDSGLRGASRILRARPKGSEREDSAGGNLWTRPMDRRYIQVHGRLQSRGYFPNGHISATSCRKAASSRFAILRRRIEEGVSFPSPESSRGGQRAWVNRFTVIGVTGFY